MLIWIGLDGQILTMVSLRYTLKKDLGQTKLEGDLKKFS